MTIAVPTIAEMRAKIGVQKITVMTIFGPAEIEGPFAQDYTTLKWDFKEHRDGEYAHFRAAGLEACAQDCDGDRSIWLLKDLRTRKVIAEGSDDRNDPPHYWFCLAAAEAALRAEVARRKAAITGGATQ
jgi:hypothetical protein